MPVTKSKRTKENQWKSRKQSMNPHGRITSLEEFASEYDAEHGKTKS